MRFYKHTVILIYEENVLLQLLKYVPLITDMCYLYCVNIKYKAWDFTVRWLIYKQFCIMAYL